MATTIFISFFIVLIFCLALAIGQFFGRDPITPKCNPDNCCSGTRNCTRRTEKTREE